MLHFEFQSAKHPLGAYIILQVMNDLSRRISIAAIFTVGFLGACVAPAASADIAQARNTVVEVLDLTYAKLSDLSESGNRAPEAYELVIRNELVPYLDISRFARLILAKYWRSATDAQREKYVAVLEEFLVRSFTTAIVLNADDVSTYRENIEIQEARQGARDNRAVVPLTVYGANNRSYRVDIRMGNSDGIWRIYDIVFEGISFAINYRTIITAEISKHGIDAVAETLEEKLSSARVVAKN